MHKSTEEFIHNFESVSPKMQSAFYWLIENIDLAEAMIAEDSSTPEELEKMLATAKQRDDALMQILIKYELAVKYGEI